MKWKKTAFKLGYALLVFLIVFSSIKYLQTSQQESYWISIYGQVKLTNESRAKFERGIPLVNSKPESVTIKHNVNDFNNYKSFSKVFSEKRIVWTNETDGYVNQTLKIPYDLDLFVYTRKEGDVPAIISIKRTIKDYSVILYWDGHFVEKRPIYNADQQKIITDDMRGEVSHLLESLDIVDKFRKNASADISLAEDNVKYGNREVGENKLKQFLYAEWYFRRAKYKLYLGQLHYCIYQQKKLIDEHNPAFFNIPYEQKFFLNETWSFLEEHSLNKSELVENWINQFENTTIINNKLNYLSYDIADLKTKVEYCNGLSTEVENNYFFQGSLFRRRILFLLVVITLSFYLGKASNMGEKANNIAIKLGNWTNSFKNWIQHRDFSKGQNFLFTAIVGIIAGNIAFLQTIQGGVGQEFNLPIVLSLLFAAFAFILSLIRFSETNVNHKLDKIIFILVIISIITFPVFFNFIMAGLQFAFFLLKFILQWLFEVLSFK
ncbi:hypothetical protein HYV84_08230 [Candidatus Woesearchaeota archaeon]|nr:hypothetical protein [Candidatus Woesearchaeota archaeon]